MSRSNSSMNLKWLLIMGLVLLLLLTFISCAKDIIGPRLDEEDPDEEKDKKEEDVVPDPPAMSSLRSSTFLVQAQSSIYS